MDCYKGGKLYFFKGLALPENMFLSNLISWAKAKKFKETVYKKDSEMADEINCTERSIRYIRTKLLKRGFLKIDKRKNLKFNGSTPYILNLEKIKETGNQEIDKEINKLVEEGGDNFVRGSDKNDNSLRQKRTQGVTKLSVHIIDTDTLSNTQNKHPSLLNTSPASRFSSVADATRVCSDDSGNEKKDTLPDGFAQWWEVWPEKKEKMPAFKAYKAAIKHIKHDELLRRTENYVEHYNSKKSGGGFVPNHKNPATWLNQRIWDEDEYKIVKSKALTEAEKRAEVDRIEAEYYAKKEQEKLNAAS